MEGHVELARRVVTTRSGGISAPPFDTFNLSPRVGDSPSAVNANRARLAVELGMPPSQLVWMNQVHGSAVAVVDGPSNWEPPECDGIVTNVPGLALAVLVADCVPALLVENNTGVVAAVHLGRKGAAAGIVLRALEAMTGLGANISAIDVLLGPAICGGCYEVPLEMQRDIARTLPGSACNTRGGTPGLDLKAALAAQLTTAGVGSVVTDLRCTAEDPALFSYRRDGRTGRQAGIVWLPHAE